MIARGAAVVDGGGDPLGDRVRLIRAGREAQQLDGPADRLGTAERGLRSQALVDPLLRLEPIGIVVLDQAMRRVEDRLAAAEVLDEHHPPGARIGGAEAEDVREGSAAEPVDALVVVPNHRDIG